MCTFVYFFPLSFSIIYKSTNTHDLKFYLYEDTRQADAFFFFFWHLSLGWSNTNTKTQPVPWALKALSNNGLKRPHSAGSNMHFGVSARSLTQLLEGEQMCPSPWMNYESTVNHPYSPSPYQMCLAAGSLE